MIRPLIAVTLLVLAGCASSPAPEPKIDPHPYPVAVAASCVPKNAPQRPAFTDTPEARIAAPNPAVDYQLLASNWGMHTAYEDAQEQIVKGCR